MDFRKLQIHTEIVFLRHILKHKRFLKIIRFTKNFAARRFLNIKVLENFDFAKKKSLIVVGNRSLGTFSVSGHILGPLKIENCQLYDKPY